MMYRYDVPDAVYDQVVAFVEDYERRCRVIAESESGKNRHPISVLERYRFINRAIDEALDTTCHGECERVRALLRTDIANRSGFEHSCAKGYYQTRGVFWARKRLAVKLIAENMKLI